MSVLHNQTVTAHRLFGGSSSRKLQSVQAPLCSFSPPHFASPGPAAQALIRAGKTSVT